MKYNFEKFEKRRQGHDNLRDLQLSITKSQFSISKFMVDEMRSPERIDILFDRESEVIALRGSKTGWSLKVQYGSRSSHISLHKRGMELPMGRYSFIKKEGDLFIFKLEKRHSKIK